MNGENVLIEQQLEFGEPVTHWLFGCGDVLGEWRNFRSCKICFRESPLGTKYARALLAGKVITADHNVDCQHCGGPTHVINAAGIYEVLFADGKTRSINSVWLKREPRCELLSAA